MVAESQQYDKVQITFGPLAFTGPEENISTAKRGMREYNKISADHGRVKKNVNQINYYEEKLSNSRGGQEGVLIE